jgi:hypothetical protein
LHIANTGGQSADREFVVPLAPTLLVPYADLVAPGAQLRPPGIFFANAIAATFVMFATAHRFSRPTRRITVYDLALVYTPFLLMAKIGVVFLVAAFAYRYISAADTSERRTVRSLTLASCALFLVHWAFFPGVVHERLSLDLFYISVGVRVIDILMSFGLDDASARSSMAALGGREFEFEYGYDVAPGAFTGIRFLLVVAPLLLVSLLVLRRRAKGHRLAAEERRRARFLLLAFAFTFVANPLLGLPIVAYVFGPYLTPFIRRRAAAGRNARYRVAPSFGGGGS